MDKEKLNLVVLAGLLHDVGKFFERGEIFSESRKDETCLGFCPSDKKGGFHTHLHCAHTKFFCDYLDERFACLRTMPSKDWKTWSSGHHLSDEQSLESKVIRLADRLSSSEREEGQYYQRGIGQRTLLEPILEKVFLQSNQDRLSTSYRYPLTRLNSDEESLFPKLWKDFDEELEFSHDAHKGLEDPKKWSHLLCKTSLKGGYEALCNSFLDDVNALSEKSPDIALGDLTVCLNSILERYTSNVPSATNVRHPDISLYDHMRTTASIAQALYVQQMKQDNPLANLEVENDPKWLLACGDFSGIQKFIYNLTNRGAARGLRGRSYYVQLFCQLSCRYILRKLSLNSAALLYDSGGRFYILLPSCMKKDLLKARGDINAWLLKKFGGSVYLGLGVAPVTAGMFAQGNMHEAWKEAAENLERDRSQKFMECFSDLEFFEPQIEFDPTKSCPVCGSKEVSRSVKCSLCEDLESLGIWLRDTEAVLTLWDREASDRISSLLSTTRKISFDGLGADAIMVSRRDLSLLSSIKSSQTECLFLNEVGEQSIASLDLPKTGMAVQFSYLGKWDLRRQMDEDKPWDFDRYAAESKGIKRLGILRMDVDNLGLVFIQGLRFPKRESLRIDDRDIPGWGEVVLEKSITQRKSMASISRMTTLSRQLKNFFSGFLVNLLKQEDFDKCQIIYSGGDDLFIIGSWHQLPGLAEAIQQKFRAFCCDNPDMSISGGITLHRGRYPIYKASQLAGEAERKAKNVRGEWLGRQELKKAGICFQNTAIFWEDWDLAQKIIVMLQQESAQERSRGLASYLRQVTAGNNALVRRIMNEKKINETSAWLEIAYYPWHWRTKYQLKRRYGDNTQEIGMWSKILFDLGRIDALKGQQSPGSTIPVFAWLEMPLSIADYLQR